MYSHAVRAGEEYIQRLKDREARVAQHEAIHIRLGNFRLVLALIAAVIAWESLKQHAISPWWLLVPATVFVGVAAYHSRVLRARDLAQRAVSFYQGGLARIEDRWQGTGQTGERFADPHHVYAADLDLFGRGSLFELLSTARTRMGEETLANWLLVPSTVDEIVERHAAIRELRDQLDLREDLAVLGVDASVGVHPEELLRWAEAPNRMRPEWMRWLSLILGIMAIAGAVVWGYWDIVTPLVAIILIEAILRYRLRKPLEEVLHSSEHAFRDLGLLSGVLARVEQQAFSSPRLTSLQHQLSSNGVTSSHAIARLKTIIDFSDSRKNLIVGFLDVPLMYSEQVAFAAECWRRAHGHAVGSWLKAIGEIEALISLSTYSYEHPDDPFPEFVKGASCFDATEIRHPLISLRACIPNDVHLLDGTRVLLVSGSNMSGKSTLLRTVGINVVLANAGAPIRGTSLRLSPVALGTRIRSGDSLQEGRSNFFTEILHIRQVFELVDGVYHKQLLFLFDELLEGTNSKDRRIGAEGLLRALVTNGAIGIVTTHDLALTAVTVTLGNVVRNYHFQDYVEGGQMRFDYTLREGVVAKSNAIELMRLIGLKV
jgi:MutS domain V